jgi:hypothetical protein
MIILPILVIVITRDTPKLWAKSSQVHESPKKTAARKFFPEVIVGLTMVETPTDVPLLTSIWNQAVPSSSLAPYITAEEPTPPSTK